ncbi:hypothetical protein CH252_31060 [Rhodococcus sp. 06-1477-1B]|nr:hypothetical protein CH252_31060 [Rhodococcus sp. 06-1477-1B]
MRFPGFVSPWEEPGFDQWQGELKTIDAVGVRVRLAEPVPEDGKWMRWMQADSESATIQSVEFNVASITTKTVFLADVGGWPVGFCRAVAGRSLSDPLFVQMIAVVPAARRRGVGLALLAAAASSQPDRDVVMATLDDNTAARAMNERFARSLGLEIRRVPIRSYRRSEMGLGPGEKHRPWLIERGAEAAGAD